MKGTVVKGLPAPDTSVRVLICPKKHGNAGAPEKKPLLYRHKNGEIVQLCTIPAYVYFRMAVSVCILPS
jgi:hypothetical protein